MQRPMVSFSTTALPPLYLWPRPLKNMLLISAIGVVVLSYLLLVTGLVTVGIMLFGGIQ